ncbi:hypothetical protein IAT40_001209 [Kwoniella sp. CBS 6097]
MIECSDRSCRPQYGWIYLHRRLFEPLPVERSQGSVSALVARFQNAADRDKEAAARESRRSSLVPPGSSSRRSSASASASGYGYAHSSSNGPSPAASPLPGGTPRLSSSSGALPPFEDIEKDEQGQEGQEEKEEILKSPVRADIDSDPGARPNGKRKGEGEFGILDRAGEKMKSLELKLEKVLISDKEKDKDLNVAADADQAQKKGATEELTASSASPSRPPKSPKRMSSSTPLSALAVPEPKSDSEVAVAASNEERGESENTTQVGAEAGVKEAGKDRQLIESNNHVADKSASTPKKGNGRAGSLHTNSDTKRTPSSTSKGTPTSTSASKAFPRSSTSSTTSRSAIKTAPTKSTSTSTSTSVSTPTPRSRLSSGTSASTTTPRARVSLSSSNSASASAARKPAVETTPPAADKHSGQPGSAQNTTSTPKLTPSHTGPASGRRSSSVMAAAKASPSPLKPHLTGTPSKPTASSLAKARTPSASGAPATGTSTTSSHSAGDKRESSMSLGRQSGGKVLAQRARQCSASPSPAGTAAGARRRPSSVLGSSGDQVQVQTPSKARSTTAPATTPSNSSGTGSRLLQGTAASRARAAAAHPHPRESPSASATSSTPSKSNASSSVPGPGLKSTSTPQTPSIPANASSRAKTPSSLRAKTPSTGRARVKIQADGSNVHNPADVPKMPPVGKSPIGRLGLAAAGMERPEGPGSNTVVVGGGITVKSKPDQTGNTGGSKISGGGETGEGQEEEGVEEVREIASHQAEAKGQDQGQGIDDREEPIERPRTPSPGHNHHHHHHGEITAKNDVEEGAERGERKANIIIASPDQPLVSNNHDDDNDDNDDGTTVTPTGAKESKISSKDSASKDVGQAGEGNQKGLQKEEELGDESLEEIPDIE